MNERVTAVNKNMKYSDSRSGKLQQTPDLSKCDICSTGLYFYNKYCIVIISVVNATFITEIPITFVEPECLVITLPSFSPSTETTIFR